MKQFIGIILIFTLVSSCTESFNLLDTKKFNDRIVNRTDIETPEELIKLYYGNSDNLLNQKPIIKVENLGDHIFRIYLIDENLSDDSQFGQKIVMTAKLVGQNWSVTEIKENWKCRHGRGHWSWGIEKCN